MRSLPQIQKISEDQMRKIYPEKYYKKYAKHANILSYQTETLNHEANDDYQILRKRRSQDMPKLPEVPEKKQYNPRFETYKSIIEINKYEVDRVGKFTKALSIKLQSSPEKKTNFIRPPFIQKYQIQENVLKRLKAIEDMEYETVLKQRDRRKKIIQQKSLCKFVRRSRSNQASPNKSISSQQIQKNPQYSSLQAFIEKAKAKSKMLTSGLKSEEKATKGPRYEQISKSRQLLECQTQQLGGQKETLKTIESESTSIQKRDLIKQTSKIREQVNSMETLSYYEAILLKKKRKQLLNLL